MTKEHKWKQMQNLIIVTQALILNTYAATRNPYLQILESNMHSSLLFNQNITISCAHRTNDTKRKQQNKY